MTQRSQKIYTSTYKINKGLPYSSNDKESVCNVGDLGSIPGSGSSTREGNNNPLQYPCLANPWTEETGGLQSMGLPRVEHD